MNETFIEEWRVLLSNPGAGKKDVEYGQPLRLVFGANELGKAVFFSITSAKPGLPDLSNVVNVERGLRNLDAKWTLSLTLRDDRLLNVFMSLCEDLARRTAQTHSESHALSALLEGIAEWKHLLRNVNNDRLSLEEIRGLIGEMWFGFNCLSNKYSAGQVVAAWTGPLGRPQDFNLPGGISYEIKSCYPDSKSLKISSAEQLDPGDRNLTLVAVTLEPAEASTPGATSVRSLASLAESIMGDEGSGITLFRRCLDRLGVDLLDDYYDDFWFVAAGFRLFAIDNGFPTIRASRLDHGISGVQYSIAIASIASYETQDEGLGYSKTADRAAVQPNGLEK